MPALEEAQLAALYSEFSDEDRKLARKDCQITWRDWLRISHDHETR
jgi:hypothetical protein